MSPRRGPRYRRDRAPHRYRWFAALAIALLGGCYGAPDTAGLVPREVDGKWGFADATGHMAIAPAWDQAQPFAEDLAVVRSGTKYGYADGRGRVVHGAYEWAGRFSDGLGCVRVRGRYGYIDRSGRLVIPAQFEFADDFADGRARYKENGRWGYIDTAGQIVIPAAYESPLARAGYEQPARPFAEGLAAVSQGGRWGYIDRDGRVVIPFRYLAAASFSGGRAEVMDDAPSPARHSIDRTGAPTPHG